MRFLAIAVLVLCHVGCLNSESCLRHSDCDGDDVCVEGRCQPETGGSTVGAGGTSGAAGTSAGAAGAAGSGGAGGG